MGWVRGIAACCGAGVDGRNRDFGNASDFHSAAIDVRRWRATDSAATLAQLSNRGVRGPLTLVSI
jgi:hypothetical protein